MSHPYSYDGYLYAGEVDAMTRDEHRAEFERIANGLGLMRRTMDHYQLPGGGRVEYSQRGRGIGAINSGADCVEMHWHMVGATREAVPVLHALYVATAHLPVFFGLYERGRERLHVTAHPTGFGSGAIDDTKGT